MKKLILAIVLFLLPARGRAQTDSIVVHDSEIVNLDVLVAEVFEKNQDLRASAFTVAMKSARASGASALDPPEIRWMQDAMPEFRFGDAMFSRFELTQMVPFPSKIWLRNTLASVDAEHARHDVFERINDVVARLKSLYYELWFVQQNIVLQRQNSRLLTQFAKIAGRRYSVGTGNQLDVLKAQIEQTSSDVEIDQLRQREIGLKAKLSAMLDRSAADTLGYAVVPEEFLTPSNLDTLLRICVTTRPMIVHDSLGISEASTMQSLAGASLLPDFRFGLERVIQPTSDFRGWSVSVGITLPFVPWSIGKSSAESDEAAAGFEKATADYRADVLRISGNIRDLFARAEGMRSRLVAYRDALLPRSDQALRAGLASYETGQSDVLMVLDAFRTNVSLTREYYMARLELEQILAELEKEVGISPLPGLR